MLCAVEHIFQVQKYFLKIISDYMLHLTLLYETTEGEQNKAVTIGVTQGCLLGLDLGNVCYNILRAALPEDFVLVGYTDDVTAPIGARNVELA